MRDSRAIRSEAIRTLILAVALLLAVVGLAAQTLPLDLNGYPLPSGKSFYTINYSPAADSSWDAVTLPAGAYKVLIVGNTGGVDIRLDDSNSDNYFATIPVSVPVILDVANMTSFYIRRSAVDTATIVHLIFFLL